MMDIRLAAAMALRPDLFEELKLADVVCYSDSDVPWAALITNIERTFPSLKEFDWDGKIIKLWETDSRAQAKMLNAIRHGFERGFDASFGDGDEHNDDDSTEGSLPDETD